MLFFIFAKITTCFFSIFDYGAYVYNGTVKIEISISIFEKCRLRTTKTYILYIPSQPIPNSFRTQNLIISLSANTY